jgi:sulfoxide reductase heme-binding subunit YedZ
MKAWIYKRISNRLWIPVHILAIVPLVWLLADFWFDNLSVNPIQDITLRTGEAALKLLVLSLACTPVNILFGFRDVLPLRKPLGMYAFMYAMLHFLTFIGLDYGLDWGLIREAIFEKQFALAGFVAFILMIPLALTSNQWSMKQLGKNWKRLHQAVYLIGLLAILHFLWARKLDLDPEALIYGLIVIILLIIRIPRLRKSIINYRRR